MFVTVGGWSRLRQVLYESFKSVLLPFSKINKDCVFFINLIVHAFELYCWFIQMVDCYLCLRNLHCDTYCSCQYSGLIALIIKQKTISVLVKHIGVPKFESKSDAEGIICMQGKKKQETIRDGISCCTSEIFCLIKVYPHFMLNMNHAVVYLSTLSNQLRSKGFRLQAHHQGIEQSVAYL